MGLTAERILAHIGGDIYLYIVSRNYKTCPRFPWRISLKLYKTETNKLHVRAPVTLASGFYFHLFFCFTHHSFFPLSHSFTWCFPQRAAAFFRSLHVPSFYFHNSFFHSRVRQ